jgi:hypothetical protein
MFFFASMIQYPAGVGFVPSPLWCSSLSRWLIIMSAPVRKRNSSLVVALLTESRATTQLWSSSLRCSVRVIIFSLVLVCF